MSLIPTAPEGSDELDGRRFRWHHLYYALALCFEVQMTAVLDVPGPALPKKMTLDDWDIVMNVHMNGTAYVTHAAWPIMNEQNYGRIVLTSSGSGIYGNFGQANYGAAKMGMLGMMNVLALEGAKNNVRVNTLAPGASTRMIATIPGRDFDPDDPPPQSSPKLVTPAVLYMCSEDAPNGVVINAMRGRYYRAQVFVNDPVEIGIDATFEDLQPEAERLLDMSAAHPPER